VGSVSFNLGVSNQGKKDPKDKVRLSLLALFTILIQILSWIFTVDPKQVVKGVFL
jgi:hypothetical protein